MEQTKRKFHASMINDYRAFVFLGIVLIFGIFANNFYTLYNFTSIFSGSSLYTFIGLAFTLCMIAGHMDLSVGYMATMGAMMVLGMRTLEGLPWGVAFLVAAGVGALFGLANGILVAKAKIHSFIVTLGMQFVIKGLLNIYSNGAEISVKGDFEVTDILNSSPIPFLPFSVLFLFTLAAVIILMVVLAKTRFGRNVYMLGGNLETAWLAGIKSDRNTILIFMISGILCGLGGALYGVSAGTATPTLGEKGIAPLMVGLTATIIGGTDIAGGKGSVLNTFVSIVAILAMFGVITTLVGKFEVQILFIGIVLAFCVLYETFTKYAKQKTLGIRPDLVQKYMQESGKTKL
ncbi:ABC transporter permease [Christensenellaceae bacterium OttesenSCG-928-K19]|nr:ABC transporter permease [Christensenellaceae bacterium OttesenSCG-928-K19]